MHIVHYDTAYPNAGEATKNKGGIAVLGFFVEVGFHFNSLSGPQDRHCVNVI